MAKIYITDTILRDAHQSQAATRMRLSDMLPACELLDSIGYWSLECWGGATFDACMRFLNEDPWERLRQLKKALPKTKLQMLFRVPSLQIRSAPLAAGPHWDCPAWGDTMASLAP